MINLADPNWIIAISSIVFALIVGIVWFIRLEGKTNQGEKDLIRVENAVRLLESKVDVTIKEISDKLSNIEISIARLDSRFNTTKKR